MRKALGLELVLVFQVHQKDHNLMNKVVMVVVNGVRRIFYHFTKSWKTEKKLDLDVSVTYLG